MKINGDKYEEKNGIETSYENKSNNFMDILFNGIIGTYIHSFTHMVNYKFSIKRFSFCVIAR